MRVDRVKAQGAVCLAVLCSGIGASVAAGGSAAAPLTLAAPEVLRLVQNAPAQLSSYPALRIHGTITYVINGHTIRATLSGVSTPDGQSGTMTLAVPSVGKKFTFLTVNRKLFLHLPSGALPGGAHYGGCNLPASGSTRFFGVGGGDTDPLSFMSLMPGATGGVHLVGHKTIDGVKTNEYEVNIDLATALQRAQQEGRASTSVSAQDLQRLGITTMPYDVWIDAQRSIRQIGWRLSQHDIGVKTQFRFSGASAPPVVSEPPASDVYYTHDCNSLGALAAFQ